MSKITIYDNFGEKIKTVDGEVIKSYPVPAGGFQLATIRLQCGKEMTKVYIADAQ